MDGILSLGVESRFSFGDRRVSSAAPEEMALMVLYPLPTTASPHLIAGLVLFCFLFPSRILKHSGHRVGQEELNSKCPLNAAIVFRVPAALFTCSELTGG